ncbi:Tryptophan synthase alpha chain [invertebrate metagenome]|uniref:tryptophan synthase n=1 Tax=invertebrate metagenome TaxID=1711999 RepID=A0A2H9T991_9ZZZZ
MRITNCFNALEEKDRTALIPYITAGSPDPEVTVRIMHELVRHGSDIIELGFPFSDPVADGPVIAQAHQDALNHGVTLNDVLSMVARFRKNDITTPIVLMGYMNPLEMMGYETFTEKASNAGVDGVLIVDLPAEPARDLNQVLVKKQIVMIQLITPSTPDHRIKTICSIAGGYLYYVSIKGVTGSAIPDTDSVNQRVQHIRQFTHLPVAVGFGIRDGQSAAAVGHVADAVVTGTVLVRDLLNYSSAGEQCIQDACSRINEMRQALDA